MSRFKVGDRVRVKYAGVDTYSIGSVRTVVRVTDNHVWLDGCTAPWNIKNDIEKYLEKVEKVRFILQYELDRDPFETFSTMQEVEARIKELAKRTDLKRDSIKVYEIAKTYDVSLETRIVFGPKVKFTEKKRGRPFGSKNKKRGPGRPKGSKNKK